VWYVDRPLASARRAALLTGLLLSARVANARGEEAAGAHVALDWTRTPGAERCISPEELLARTRPRVSSATLSFDQQGADFIVVGRIEPRAKGFRTELVLRDGSGRRLGERTFESPARSCRALDESLVLAITMLVDTPSVRGRMHGEPGERGEHVGSGGELPPPDRLETPPQPPIATERTTSPSPSPRALESPAPPKPPWGIDLGLGASATGGFTPRPTVGPTLQGMIHPPGFFPIALRGTLYPFAVDRVTVPGEGISVRGFVAGVDLCPLGLARGRLEALACAGAYLGGLHAQPLGPRSSAGDLLFPVLPLRGEVRARLHALAPYAAIATRFSPTSPDFIYRAPRGEERASFGVFWATVELELGIVWRISPAN
jgi:hypothetical protein